MGEVQTRYKFKLVSVSNDLILLSNLFTFKLIYKQIIMGWAGDQKFKVLKIDRTCIKSLETSFLVAYTDDILIGPSRI